MTSRKAKEDEGKIGVLVWERDEAARDLIETYCTEHEWRVHVVENHADLEDRAAARPELVFVEFPNLFFTREDDLIEFAGRHRTTAVVAMVDGAHCNRVAHLLDKGIADCLIKPVDETTLDASAGRARANLEKQVLEDRVKRSWWRRALDLVGIDVPLNGMDKTRVRPRLYVILAVALAVVLGGGFGFLEYSTSPTFCNSCHIMNPFVTAWEESTHSEVGCVDCHYPPGEYWKTKFQAISQVTDWVTGRYSTKPYAEVDDENCLACHTTRLLKGQVVFKRGIKFDHVPHLEKLSRGKKLKCTTCHSQIVQGEHVAVNERVCFICHFMGEVKGIEPKSQEFCTKCHLPPEEDIELAGITYNHKDFVKSGVECQRCHLEVVEGDGAVAQHMCYTCHGEPERLARIGEDEFLHKTHVTEHKVECDQCHGEIVHKVKTHTAPLEYDCRICHTSSHDGIKKMYMGTGGRGVEDQPNPMYLAQVDCIGCHVETSPPLDEVVSFGEKTLGAVERGCTNCHGSDYEGLLEMWLDDVQADVEKTSVLIEAAGEALAAADKSKKTGKAASLFEEANYNFHYVKTFHGAHNPDYSASLLVKAREDATRVLDLLGAPLPGDAD
ncbi:MAG: NapC/NirT family cytochrome c [Deltaproteobacteria bacterium]|nr:NapC/NirT family cytochrome c [Deltaproteobacteria bacterium]